MNTEESKDEATTTVSRFSTQTLRDAVQSSLDAIIARLHKAERTLNYAGFKDRGGELWEPPLGKMPRRDGPGFVRKGVMLPTDHPDYPPREIIEAARKIGNWGVQYGGEGWQIGPCADRFYYVNPSPAKSPTAWEACERIANLPGVDDALRNFSEDPTGDSGVIVVQAVIKAITKG